MTAIQIDISDDDGQLAEIGCEMSWFVINVGPLALTVSFEQLQAIHDAARPFFVEEKPQR